MTDFVPKDFEIPKNLKTDRFCIRMLTIDDVDKDYEAVMSSIGNLKGVFGPDNEWPSKSLTKKQDLIDLGWHQKEFQRRSSFTYTVLSPDESKCLGCVYIYPSERPDYDAKVMLWVRASEKDTGLDEHLFQTLKKWLQIKWPFEKIGYPGRDISWEAWESM